MNDSQPSDVGTRDRLLVAARACVRDGGLAAVTSRQITTEAGANLASITYHFGSKEALVAEALFGELDRRLAVAVDLLERPDAAPTRLMAAVQALTVEFERSAADVPVYLEALLGATRPGPLADRAGELLGTLHERIAAVAVALVAAGTIPGWVDPEAMASLIIATANGIALQTRLDPDGPSHTAMASQLGALLLAAAGPRP